MTSNQVLNSLGNMIFTPVNSTQTATKGTGIDFQQFMNNSQKEASTETQSTEKKQFLNLNSKTAEKIKNLENVVGKEKRVEVTNVEPDGQPEDTMVEEIVAVINEIIGAISETLDVTENEIKEALENLGLNVIALLDSDTAPALVMELTGTDDRLNLVTDENLFNRVEKIGETIDELVNELTERLELPELKENVKDLGENIEVADETIAVTEMPEKTVKADEAKADNFTEKIVVEVKTEEKTVAVISDNESGKSDNKEPEAKTETKITEIAEQPEETIKETTTSFAENLLSKVKDTFETVSEKISYSSDSVENAERILNQITESVKVQISMENTEVNLKLHPETLGNVNVKISASNEGTMTAQFTAQNESVKAVLESQIIVLKETLEAKGISIEAVEVMVGSHEFDENLSKNGDRDGKPQKRTSIRRIDLSAMEDVEDLSEEETLQKEIMEQNGNTVDYTA